ncbi:MAG: type II toxin-antitoxin system VapC family toxin [Desulfurococcales archaeon]|nr:type II toxin-antitoxin system VapC family toxin [Desulfurococcales archaeon]
MLDTSVVVELFDRGNTGLLEDIMDKYSALYIPWIVLYEYLYGHRYLGREIEGRKAAVEKLGQVVGVTQDIIVKAMEIDVDLHKKGLAIPFSDILVAATVLVLEAELVTLDKRHYTRIPGLQVYIPESPKKP